MVETPPRENVKRAPTCPVGRRTRERMDAHKVLVGDTRHRVAPLRVVEYVLRLGLDGSFEGRPAVVDRARATITPVSAIRRASESMHCDCVLRRAWWRPGDWCRSGQDG